MNEYGYITNNNNIDEEITGILSDISGNKELKDIKKEIEAGNWKLNYQEIRYVKNNPDKMESYLKYRYSFHKSTKEIPDEIEFPIYSVIEPSSICNLRCTMCFQQDQALHREPYVGNMSMSTFKNAIDQLQDGNCGAITFAGRGEPLLNKEFSNFLDYSSNKFFELKINTNGLLLTDEICDAILRNNVDLIVFSAEGTNQTEYGQTRIGGDFSRLIHNIERFNRIKDTHYPQSKTQTRVMGVMAHKFDEKKYFDFWKNYVDEAVLSICEDRSDTYNNLKTGRNSPCLRLWYRTYIWWNGDCSPCDVDYLQKLNYGNINEKPLKEMWKDSSLISYRKEHLNNMRTICEPCNRCDV